jgi:hypothetical protein
MRQDYGLNFPLVLLLLVARAVYPVVASGNNDFDDDYSVEEREDDFMSNYGSTATSNVNISRSYNLAKCNEFLDSFLTSATNSRERCEGISNAFNAAGKLRTICSVLLMACS